MVRRSKMKGALVIIVVALISCVYGADILPLLPPEESPPGIIGTPSVLGQAPPPSDYPPIVGATPPSPDGLSTNSPPSPPVVCEACATCQNPCPKNGPPPSPPLILPPPPPAASNCPPSAPGSATPSPPYRYIYGGKNTPPGPYPFYNYYNYTTSSSNSLAPTSPISLLLATLLSFMKLYF